jgi:hypothetical protein
MRAAPQRSLFVLAMTPHASADMMRLPVRDNWLLNRHFTTVSDDKHIVSTISGDRKFWFLPAISRALYNTLPVQCAMLNSYSSPSTWSLELFRYLSRSPAIKQFSYSHLKHNQLTNKIHATQSFLRS